MKQSIKLNEEQLRQIVAESVSSILKEAEMDEGFWDNLKAGVKGAKQGFNAQKSLDRGTQGFKQEHDYEDMRQDMSPFGKKSENTAQEQANQLFTQAKEYQAMANKLKAQAQAITKQYGLAKSGVNQRTSTQKQPVSGNVPNFKPATQSIRGSRTNTARDTRPTGLFGK